MDAAAESLASPQPTPSSFPSVYGWFFAPVAIAAFMSLCFPGPAFHGGLAVLAKWLPLQWALFQSLQLWNRPRPTKWLIGCLGGSIAIYTTACLAIRSGSFISSSVYRAVLTGAALLPLLLTCVRAYVPFPRLTRLLKQNPTLPTLIAIPVTLYCFREPLAKGLWNILSSPVIRVVVSILNAIGVSATGNYSDGRYPRVTIDGIISTSVNWPCSGMEGVLLFAYVACLLFILDYPRTTAKRAAFFFGTGIVTMWLANLFRIALFFWIASRQPKGLEYQTVRANTLSLFHDNMGIAIYLVTVLLFVGVYSFWGSRQTTAAGKLPAISN